MKEQSMNPATIIKTLTNSAVLRVDIASETYHITCETDTATSIHIDLSSQNVTSTDDDKQTTVSTPNAAVFCFAIVFRLAPLWRQAEGLKTIRGMHTFSNLETEWTMRRETLEAPRFLFRNANDPSLVFSTTNPNMDAVITKASSLDLSALLTAYTQPEPSHVYALM